MAAANNEFFEALSMLEHERGITAEYLIEKIKAAIIIAVKKNYEVEEDHVKVDIDPDTGRFDVALIQDVVADEDWYDEHSEIGITEAQKIRKTYEVGDRIITPLKTKDFGRIAAQLLDHSGHAAAVLADAGRDGVNVGVEKLGGEKIDIVKWSEDVSEFISAALSPAKVVKVELLPGETRSCRVTVPDQQLSLAIGNKGQNARLCARLTGYNIDIRPESGYYGEDEEPKKKEEAADAE